MVLSLRPPSVYSGNVRCTQHAVISVCSSVVVLYQRIRRVTLRSRATCCVVLVATYCYMPQYAATQHTAFGVSKPYSVCASVSGFRKLLSRQRARNAEAATAEAEEVIRSRPSTPKLLKTVIKVRRQIPTLEYVSLLCHYINQLTTVRPTSVLCRLQHVHYHLCPDVWWLYVLHLFRSYSHLGIAIT